MVRALFIPMAFPAADVHESVLCRYAASTRGLVHQGHVAFRTKVHWSRWPWVCRGSNAVSGLNSLQTESGFSSASVFASLGNQSAHGSRFERSSHCAASGLPMICSVAGSQRMGFPSQWPRLARWQTVTLRQPTSTSQIGRWRVRRRWATNSAVQAAVRMLS